MKRALFPGTFDPFTRGHYSVVKRALNIVDEVVIAIGVNDSKSTYFTLEQRLTMLQSFFSNTPQVKIASYGGLTVDFAQQMEARYIVRGIRTVTDFEYEKTIADVNRKLSGVETIVLFTEPELTHVSSTIVRELLRYGRDVSDMLPDGFNIAYK